MAQFGKNFKAEMVAFALADATIAAKIGNRLWAVRAAQATTVPYVVWQTISGIPTYAHDGPTGNEEIRIQFSIFAADVATCEDIRDAFRNRFDGYKGNWTTIRIGYCFSDNDVDSAADTAELRQKSIDFRFMASQL